MTPRRPLKVLHVRNSDLLGGPERLILGQAAHRGADVEVGVAAFVRPGGTSALLEEAGHLGARAHALRQRGSYDPRVAGRLAALLREEQPDLLVGHDYKANFLLRRAIRRVRRPLACVLHGYTAEDRKVRAFEALDRRALRRADAVIAVSEGLRELALDFRVPAERVHVVRNAVDADEVAAEATAGRDAVRAAWGLGDGETVVMALGRLSPEKGHADLLEAFAAVAPRAPRARLVLVGDGAARSALEARATRPPLAGRVTFAGWRTDPWACLGAADLVVFPSLREGLPVALLEAMAAARQVVATRVGDMPRALAEGRLGALVPPADPRALAAALEAGLRGAAHGAPADAAAAHVRRHFGAPAQVHSLESLYRRLARARDAAVA